MLSVSSRVSRKSPAGLRQETNAATRQSGYMLAPSESAVSSRALWDEMPRVVADVLIQVEYPFIAANSETQMGRAL